MLIKPASMWFGAAVLVAVIAIVFLVGRLAGLNSAELDCEKDKRASIERAIEKVNKIADANEKVAAAHVDTIDHIEAVYKKVKEKTDVYLQSRPVIYSCDIGPDGLLLWNKSNTAATQSGR